MDVAVLRDQERQGLGWVQFCCSIFEVHIFLLGRVRDRGDFEGLDRPSSFSLLLDLLSVSPHPRSGASQWKNICIYILQAQAFGPLTFVVASRTESCGCSLGRNL